jgi:uncharacterized protein (TIGR02453 family)
MGARLQAKYPGIVVDTRTNGSGSVFRIYRDIRFSSDKAPYKTYLGILFWQGGFKKAENPGFYFHLEAEKLMLFTGVHHFNRAILNAYREYVIQPGVKEDLDQMISKVKSNPEIAIGNVGYTATPRGYKPYADNPYLYYDGLHAMYTTEIPAQLFGSELIDFAFDRYMQMAPVFEWNHNWISKLVIA